VKTKVCSRCFKRKYIDKFPVATKYKDGVHFYCCKCKTEYMKQHYEKDKEKYLARSKRTRKDLRLWLDGLKDTPCLDCGIKFPICCMDFDHRENKEFNIGRKYYSYSKEVVLKEMEKCDLVCANCHRIRTSKRLNAPMV
jgi:hypothetical protein